MEYRTVATTCTYCGTGCGMLLEVVGNSLSRTIPRKSDPILRRPRTPNRRRMSLPREEIQIQIQIEIEIEKNLITKIGTSTAASKVKVQID